MSKGGANAKIVIYKSALYGVILFFIGILQASFFSKINLTGATPDLLLGATLAIAMFEDERTSAICGIVAGFIYYALGAPASLLYLPFSFVFACAFCFITSRTVGRGYIPYLVIALFGFAAKAAFNLALILLSAGNSAVFHAIGGIILPEYLSSMIFCSIPYFIFSKTVKIFNK